MRAAITGSGLPWFRVGWPCRGGHVPRRSERAGAGVRSDAHETTGRLSQLLGPAVPVRDRRGFDAVLVAMDRTPLAGAVAGQRAAIRSRFSLRGTRLGGLPRRAGLLQLALGSRGLALGAAGRMSRA